MERLVWYWKQIHKYPFTTSLFNKLVIFTVCTVGMFWFSGLIQTFSIIGFFASFISLWWPYLKANEPSKRIDIRPLLNKTDLKANSGSRFKVSIVFDKRNRIERLTDTISQIFNSNLSSKEKIEAGIQQLGDEEYLIVSVGKQLSRYVQFICKNGQIELEIPLPKLESEKIREVEAVINNHKLYPGLWLNGTQLNPHIYYTKENWGNKEKKPFVIYTVYFRKQYNLAAQFGIDFLHSVHGWKEASPLTPDIGTFNKGWWHNL